MLGTNLGARDGSRKHERETKIALLREGGLFECILSSCVKVELSIDFHEPKSKVRN